MDRGFTHIVSLPWRANNEAPPWNEVCADIIEVFGLPGQRFMTHATPNSLTFYFKSDHDALLCGVLISDKV